MGGTGTSLVAPSALRGPAGHGLENNANKCTPPPVGEELSAELRAFQRARFRRSVFLRTESSLARVRKCGWVRFRSTVGVVRGAEGVGLHGLVSCGSVHSCPRCNARIMAARRVEIGSAIAAHMARGGSVIFQTFTMRHTVGDRLGDLWDTISAAWATVRRGAPWERQSALLGLVGWLRAVEVTHGPNGWHVHIHAVLFVEAAPSPLVLAQYGAWSAARWIRAVVKRGHAAPTHSNQVARLLTGPADADLARYLSKATDLGWELTGSQSKRARGAHSTDPTWALLTAAEQGDADALARWHEWEQGSHGRRMFSWSRGLREDLALDVELTDEEIVEDGDFFEVGAEITADGWARCIAEPDLIPELQEVYRRRGGAALRQWLTDHGVEHLASGDWSLAVVLERARSSG